MVKKNKRVLVTSGPTRALIDSIRYIANTSSGSLGSRIVETFLDRGIPVIHIYGSGSETPAVSEDRLYESIRVTTVDDLVDVIITIAAQGGIAAVVHAMAVLDYVPESKLQGKKPSGEEYWDIRLVRTPKVIELIRELIPDAFTVGFKLESGISDEELVNRAVSLLERCKLGLVIANRLEHIDDKHHDAFFVGEGRRVIATALSKKDIAVKLADYIMENM